MATNWPIAKVRQQFVDYFVEQGHTFWPSSAVIPHDDPTLLFINAGMNQYKTLFQGTADKSTEYGRLRTATNSQKCIRAGGKHNDLDDVGRDTYHHTFFEMLGTWSFGDYFKEKAIFMAWDLLTRVYKLPEDRLYVTYFEGDTKQGLVEDLDTKAIWKKYVPEERIIKGNVKDNFWEMGDTGPCGPCTEIHFDRIGGRNCRDLVNADDPMVIEVWNVVFMEFDRQKTGLIPLPAQHVDTGMGLERIASILQGVPSNYDTDGWTPLFAAIQNVTKHPEAYDKNKPNSDDCTVAYRVIADHIRCLTISLADGAMPDSVGRGFVLRRIIRRAIRYGIQFLGAETGFFHQLVDAVVASLGDFFPELKDEKTITRVKAILKDEEESFAKTWKNGLKHFETAKENATKDGKTVINGAEAFVLHDRYGFPVDLTTLLAEKEGMTVDLEGFQAEMSKNQVSGGRVAAAKTFIDIHQLDVLKSTDVPVTDDSSKYVWEASTGSVLAIFDTKKGSFVDTTDSTVGDSIGVVLSTTNFYAEAGGQIYDTGVIVGASGTFEVAKVVSIAGYIVHIGKMATGTLAKSESTKLEVNYDRRKPIAANHTATHQLNLALRVALQDEKPDSFMDVNQKGSLVTDDMLRFDFSYNGKLSNEEIARVENLMNEAIKADLAVHRKVVSLEDAKAINGLRMMFGEKYPDPVSVVCVGKSVEELLANPTNADWRKYSIEFCGGTHLGRLGDAQQTVVISEDALMKGVRRLVLYTRGAAEKAVAAGKAMQDEYTALLANKDLSIEDKKNALSVLNKRVGDSSVPLLVKNSLRADCDAAAKQLIAEQKQQLAEMKVKAASEGKEAGEAMAKDQHFFVEKLIAYGAEREALQAFADGILAARSDVGVFVIGVADDKALVVSAMSKALVEKKCSAVDWIKASVGKGGGKPAAAQSGIPAAKAGEVLDLAKAAAAKFTV